MLEEGGGEMVESGLVRLQNSFGAKGGLGGEFSDFFVNQFGGLFGIGFRGRNSIIASVLGRKNKVAELGTHAFFGNHFFGKFGDIREVGGGTSRDIVFAEDELLGDATAHGTSENVLQFIDILVTTVFGGEEPSDATGATAGDNRYLMNGVGVGENVADDGVTGFVIGGDFFLVVVHDLGLALGADGDTLEGFGQVGVSDGLVAETSSGNGRLVGDVGEVGARRAGGLFGEGVQVNVFVERFVFEMDFQNLETVLALGERDVDMAVETTGAKEGFVEHIDAVGGSDNNDAGGIFEAVHLDEDLVQGLFVFAASTTTSVTLVSDSVDFVDEDNRGGVFLGLTKQVANARSANTDEHFGKFGTGDREERDISFAGDSAGHQSLPRAWVASEEDAARNTSAESFVFFRMLQKVNDFGEVLFGGFVAGDIFEGYFFEIRAVEFRLGLAEAEVLVVEVLSLVHHANNKDNDNNNRNNNKSHIENNTKHINIFEIGDSRVFYSTGKKLVAREVGAFVD